MFHRYIKNWFNRGNNKLLVFHGMTSATNCIVCTVVNGLKENKPIYVVTTSSMLKTLKRKIGKKARVMTHRDILKRRVPTSSILIVDGILATLKNKKMKQVLSHKDRRVVLMDRNSKLLRSSHREAALRMMGNGVKRVLYIKKLEPKAFKKIKKKQVTTRDIKACIEKIKKSKGKSVVCVEKLADFVKYMNKNGYKKHGTRQKGRKYAMMDKKGIDAFNKNKVKVLVSGKNVKDKELKNVDNIHMIGSNLNKEMILDRVNRYKKGKKQKYVNIIEYKKTKRRKSKTKPVNKPKKVSKPVNKPKKVSKPVNKPKKDKKQVIVKGKGSKRLEKLLGNIQNIEGGPVIEVIA